jgi:ribosomal protein S1
VQSLAHPGGNITGLSLQVPGLAGKRLELLHAVIPGLSRVVFVQNFTNTTLQIERAEVKAVASQIAVQVRWLDVDVRGVRGRRGINLLLASALTEWRIRLREIARSPAWRALETARQEHRSVPAEVGSRVTSGLAVSIYGLNGLLPTGQVRGVHRNTPAETVDVLLRKRLGQALQVHVLRLDADTGHVFVSERAPAGRQLPLPLLSAATSD